ncbi:MAG: Chromate resistance protein ChrB [Solirubrobacteraceae bacterium]
MHAWRRLRGLGAHYVQQSVCLLPDRDETSRAVTRLLARVNDEGGTGRVIHLALTDEGEERWLTETLSAERDDEYGEVVARTGEFLAEIAMERGRGRATYTEVEESDVDLERLRKWLAQIGARDYFSADGYAQAAGAVERCAAALAQFEDEALEHELAEPKPQARRLRAVEGEQ